RGITGGESHHAQLGLLLRGEQLFPALLPTWQGGIPARFVAEPGAVVVGAGGAPARCARVGHLPASDSTAQLPGGVVRLAGDSGSRRRLGLRDRYVAGWLSRSASAQQAGSVRSCMD